MSRIRADDYDEKKRSILCNAAELFARKGFDRTTMINLAQACGASKSKLYHYFSSKEDVLFAIAMEHVSAVFEELADITNLPLPAIERFSRLVAAFMKRAGASRSEHLVLANDVHFLPEDKRQQVRELEGQLVELLIVLLKEINPQLMAPLKTRTPYAMLLFGMMIWTFTWYEEGGAISTDELALRISRLFLHGFKDDAGRL